MKKRIDNFLNWYVSSFFQRIRVLELPETDPRRINADRYSHTVDRQWNDLSIFWKLTSLISILSAIVGVLILSLLVLSFTFALATKTGAFGPTFLLILSALMVFALLYKTG